MPNNNNNNNNRENCSQHPLSMATAMVDKGGGFRTRFHLLCRLYSGSQPEAEFESKSKPSASEKSGGEGQEKEKEIALHCK